MERKQESDALSVLELLERMRANDAPQVAAALRPVAQVSHPTVDTPADRAQGDTETGSRLPAVELPERIGRFEIERLLGHGGYGLVLLGFDPQLKRHVALKIPRTDTLLTEDLQQRFVREAEAAAALNHAHIVPVFEVGRAGPVCYIAAAYCEGESLSQRLARQRVAEPRAAATLLATLADAVQHAHSRGVLHRDLKPANILLTRDPSDGAEAAGSYDWPVIADFGLARITGRNDSATATGSILGTPSYMSPEQAEAGKSPVGPAADVYSLGAVLYEMLTGRPPFEGDSLLATLDAVRHREVTSPRKLRPEIPRDLDAIALKCLEKKAADRYKTCSELGDDLERFLAGEPVRARHATRLERAVRWCRRNPVVSTLTAVAALALVAVTVVSALSALRISREQQKTLAAHRQSEANFSKAVEAVDTMLVEVGGTHLVSQPNMEPARRRLLEKALAFYQAFLAERGEDPTVRMQAAKALFQTGLIHCWLGDQSLAIEDYTRAIDLLDGLTAEFPGTAAYELARVHAEVQIAATRESMGDYTVSLADYQAALKTLQRFGGHGSGDPERRFLEFRAIGGLGLAQAHLGQVAEAETNYAEAIDGLEPLVRDHPERLEYAAELADALHRYGYLLGSTSRREEAVDAYERSLALSQLILESHALPDYMLKVAETCNRLGALHWRMEDAHRGETRYRDGLELLDRLVSNFPHVPLHRLQRASARQNLAWSLTRVDGEEAESLYREAIEDYVFLAAESPDQANLLESWANAETNLASLLDIRAQPVNRRIALLDPSPEEVRELLRSSIDKRRQLVERFPDVPQYKTSLAGSLHNLSRQLFTLREMDAGRSLVDEAIALEHQVLADNPQSTLARGYMSHHCGLLAEYHNFDGNYRELEQAADKARQYNSGWRLTVDTALRYQSCFVLAERDPDLPDDERERVARYYFDRLCEIHRQCLEEVPEDCRNIVALTSLSFFLTNYETPPRRDIARAVDYSQRAVQLEPAHPYAWLTLCHALVADGQYAEALEAIATSTELHGGDNYEHLFLACRAHARLGDFSRARSCYQRGVALLDPAIPSTSLSARRRWRQQCEELLAVE